MKKTYIIPETSVYRLTAAQSILEASVQGLGENSPQNGGTWSEGGASVGTKEDNDWDIW